MSFVPNRHEQQQSPGIMLEPYRFQCSFAVQEFFLLGNAHNRHIHPSIVAHSTYGSQLRKSTVDQQQIRRITERNVAPSCEAPSKSLCQHCRIVRRIQGAHVEQPVLILCRSTGHKNDHGNGSVLSRNVRYVVALDTYRHVFKIQDRLQNGQLSRDVTRPGRGNQFLFRVLSCEAQETRGLCRTWRCQGNCGPKSLPQSLAHNRRLGAHSVGSYPRRSSYTKPMVEIDDEIRPHDCIERLLASQVIDELCGSDQPSLAKRLPDNSNKIPLLIKREDIHVSRPGREHGVPLKQSLQRKVGVPVAYRPLILLRPRRLIHVVLELPQQRARLAVQELRQILNHLGILIVGAPVPTRRQTEA